MPTPSCPAGNGVLVRPAQANNAYVFPALGHAAMLARCSSISDEAFLTAAEVLAALANPLTVGVLVEVVLERIP